MCIRDRYLLFSEEFRLTDPIVGDPDFAAQFERRAIKDQHGRSLRQLDPKTRLLKYPCGYLIYAPSFLALTDPILDQVTTTLREVLSGKNTSDAFAHLTADDRNAILEILMDTHPLFQNAKP